MQNCNNVSHEEKKPKKQNGGQIYDAFRVVFYYNAVWVKLKSDDEHDRNFVNSEH